MPLPLLGPIIAAGAGLIGSGINAANQSSINQQNIDFQRQLYERQYKDNVEFWNMQNAYNSPQEQMKRFQEAGLNPNLIYGQGNAGNAASVQTPDTAPPQLRSPEWGNMLTSGADMLTQIYDLEMKEAQIDNLEAQNTVLQEDMMWKRVNRERAEFDLGLEKDLRDVSADARKESLRQTRTNIDNSIKRDAREALITASNLDEALERIETMYDNRATAAIQRGKTREEIDNLVQERKRVGENIKLLKQQNTLNQIEIQLRRKGINPNDPTWARMLALAIQRFIDMPAGTFKSTSPGEFFKKLLGF